MCNNYLHLIALHLLCALYIMYKRDCKPPFVDSFVIRLMKIVLSHPLVRCHWKKFLKRWLSLVQESLVWNW